MRDNSKLEKIYEEMSQDEESRPMSELLKDGISSYVDNHHDMQMAIKKVIQHYGAELPSPHTSFLMWRAPDPQEIAKLIIQAKPDLYYKEVYTLLKFATHPKEIVELLGNENMEKLDATEISYLLKDNRVVNPEEIMEIFNDSDEDSNDVDYRKSSRNSFHKSFHKPFAGVSSLLNPSGIWRSGFGGGRSGGGGSSRKW